MDGDLLEMESAIEVELEALEAIYVEELSYTRKDDGDIDQISLLLHPSTGSDTSKQFVCMTVIFKPTKQYPSEAPSITIRNPRGIGEEEVESLQEDMKLKAKEYIGEVMLYNLIEMAKDALTEGNIPHCPCVICQEHFLENEVFHRTACYHYFHSSCLSDYLTHSRQQIEDDRKQQVEEKRYHPQMEIVEKEIVCPVCRKPLDELTLSVTYTQHKEEETFEFELTEEMKQMQDKMAAMYERQKAAGGVIDVEGDKKKYTINEENRVPVLMPSESTKNNEDAVSVETPGEVSTSLENSAKERKVESDNRSHDNIKNVQYKSEKLEDKSVKRGERGRYDVRNKTYTDNRKFSGSKRGEYRGTDSRQYRDTYNKSRRTDKRESDLSNRQVYDSRNKDPSGNDDYRDRPRNDNYKDRPRNDDYQDRLRNDNSKERPKNDYSKNRSRNDDHKDRSKNDYYKDRSKSDDCKDRSKNDYYKDRSKNDYYKDRSKKDHFKDGQKQYPYADRSKNYDKTIDKDGQNVESLQVQRHSHKYYESKGGSSYDRHEDNQRSKEKYYEKVFDNNKDLYNDKRGKNKHNDKRYTLSQQNAEEQYNDSCGVEENISNSHNPIGFKASHRHKSKLYEEVYNSNDDKDNVKNEVPNSDCRNKALFVRPTLNISQKFDPLTKCCVNDCDTGNNVQDVSASTFISKEKMIIRKACGRGKPPEQTNHVFEFSRRASADKKLGVWNTGKRFISTEKSCEDRVNNGNRNYLKPEISSHSSDSQKVDNLEKFDDFHEKSEAESVDLRNLKINSRWREKTFGVKSDEPRVFGVIDDDDVQGRDLLTLPNSDHVFPRMDGLCDSSFEPRENTVDLKSIYVGYGDQENQKDDLSWEDEIDPYAFEARHIHPKQYDSYREYKKPQWEALKKLSKNRAEEKLEMAEEERRIEWEEAQKHKQKSNVLKIVVASSADTPHKPEKQAKSTDSHTMTDRNAHKNDKTVRKNDKTAHKHDNKVQKTDRTQPSASLLLSTPTVSDQKGSGFVPNEPIVWVGNKKQNKVIPGDVSKSECFSQDSGFSDKDAFSEAWERRQEIESKKRSTKSQTNVSESHTSHSGNKPHSHRLSKPTTSSTDKSYSDFQKNSISKLKKYLATENRSSEKETLLENNLSSKKPLPACIRDGTKSRQALSENDSQPTENKSTQPVNCKSKSGNINSLYQKSKPIPSCLRLNEKKAAKEKPVPTNKPLPACLRSNTSKTSESKTNS